MALSAATRLLLSLLALPPSSLPSSLSNPHVHSSISALLAHSASNSHDLEDDEHLRPLLHALVARLAQLPKAPALDLRLLALYLAAFLPSSAQLARSVVQDALANNVRLASDIRHTVPPALKQALAALDGPSGAAATTLLALVRGTVDVFTPSSTGGASATQAATELASVLVDAYDRLSSLPNPTLEQDRLRLAVLETAHALFDALAHSKSASGSLDTLHALLAVLLPKSSPPALLASDLQTHFNLSTALSDAVQGSAGPTARTVKDQLGALRRASPEEGGEAEWLERLRRADKVGGAARDGMGLDKGEAVTRAASGKGKGREVVREDAAGAEEEAEIASAISQLQDLFPDLSSSFLRFCLAHSSFSASSTAEKTERLVAALLEDNLPAELQRLKEGGAAEAASPPPPPPSAPKPAPAPAPAPTGTTRANIYDDDALFSRGKLLVGGKERKLAPSSQASSAANLKLQLDDSLKASIIALAEAPSSDEEDDEGGDGGEAFLEDEPGAAEPRIRVGDGEPKDGDGDSDGDEQGDGPQGGSTASTSSVPPASSSGGGAYHPAVLLTLESVYLRSPALFGRDSATRRGKARKELREKTGLGDEQIEGWRSMLERDPKKLQKLRDKHQDLAATANHPSSSAASSARQAPPHQQQQTSSSGQPRQQPQGASPGGRGGGRGGGQGGRGGKGGTHKGGDGGRKESDRAVRGRDRKMQRMGAGAV
ncbi:hypothetical protein JCM8097_002443 [Rhodosporidiobolus ruineniae]